ncbi:MAG TPA: class I SAM-dependent methyltransferase [Candidatus Acidoferrales bacterium]|nr:class I SAM-dependent methyltransferase [Candidatus Acidoferrales bacterium]
MNPKKVEELALRVVGDMGGTFTMALGYIGDRLGLFKAMAGEGPMRSANLAVRTQLNERYVREWLRAMVAAEYIEFDVNTDMYWMSEEQAHVLVNEDSPMFTGGIFQLATPTVWNVPRIIDAFRNGGGIPFSEIGEDVCCGIERMFRPGYMNFLVKDWLGAIPGLNEKLERGGKIADVGCGAGQSTVIMGKAFSKSKIIGIDYHGPSITRARKQAADAGLENVTFLQAPAHELPTAEPFDLICSFDCIHDMVDPRATVHAIRKALANDGVYLWSEPNATENAYQNRNPIGKAFHSISPLHCMTVSLAFNGAGLGTVIGENGARALAKEAGFTHFERLPIQNPFNQFFALRK